MNKKRLFLYLPLLLALMVGSTGCSSDEEEKDNKKSEEKAEDCYTAYVTIALIDEDIIQARIIDTPVDVDVDDVHVPRKCHYVYLLKSELGNPTLQVGDVVDFKIISYEILPPGDGPAIYGFSFRCHVKPCN